MIGINKEIDKLGRIVIPKEMRKLLQLENEVELIMTEEGLLIRNPQYIISKNVKMIDMRDFTLVKT